MSLCCTLPSGSVGNLRAAPSAGKGYQLTSNDRGIKYNNQLNNHITLVILGFSILQSEYIIIVCNFVICEFKVN